MKKKKRPFSLFCVILLLCGLLSAIQIPAAADPVYPGITFGTSQWVTINKTYAAAHGGFTPRYAPYYVDDYLNIESSTICAPVTTFSEERNGVFLISRDFNTFYVCWYDENNKECYGYVPRTFINNYQSLSYTWTNYDVYQPGILNAAVDVYSGPGGAGTFVVVNNLADATDILVLGTHTNTYSNHVYYFIQYEKSGLLYRGWVDSTYTNVSIDQKQYETPGLDDDHYYVIQKPDTDKVLAYNATSGKIELQTFQSTENQFFKIKKTLVTPFSRIIPVCAPTKAVAIRENGYYDNLELELVDISNYHKQQEFYFDAYPTLNQFDDDYSDTVVLYRIGSRSTGVHKWITVPLSPPSGQPNIIYQYGNYGAVSRHWNIIRVQDPFAGKFVASSGSITPINRKVCSYDTFMSSEFETLKNQGLLNIQHSLNMWNACDLALNLTSGDSNTNMLAYIHYNFDLPDSILGKCVAYDEFFTYDVSLNTDIFETVIYIDDEAIKSTSYYSNPNRTNAEKAAYIEDIITHELGHSLKLTHIFSQYARNPSSGEKRWLECGFQGEEMMNKYENYSAQLPSVGFNNRRLTEKWMPYLAS